MGQPVGRRHATSYRRYASARPFRLSPFLLSFAIVLVSLIQLAAPSTERPGAAFTHGRAFLVGHAYAVCPHARQFGGGHHAGTQLRMNEGYGRLARGRTVRRAVRAVVAMSQSKDDATREALERVRLEGGLPQHLGIVMDGNRRYAKSRGCPTGWGHLKGKERLEQTIRWVLIDLQIPCLTVYALSLDNLAKRSPNEVAQLCDLIAVGLDEMRCSADIKQHDIRVKIAGATEALPDRLRESVRAVEDETKERGSGGQLTLCIGYGGREDLVAAARRMAKDYAEGILVESEMTEEALGERLWTADLPDADLVIRTSGEERISNFLLWQIAYAELFFSPLPWPAFDAEALIRALEHYTHRHRRFGQ
jgi:undecaprenyl diphosphate synthase